MYSLKGFKGKLSKKNFSHTNTYIHIFLVILIEIFILKITMCRLHDKNTKKKLKKRYSRLCAPFCAKYWHLCAIVMLLCICHLFFQLTIWLLHCNAMHFDSFALGARHLFQKLVSFFYARLYL
jgi:hypothetical protein